MHRLEHCLWIGFVAAAVGFGTSAEGVEVSSKVCAVYSRSVDEGQQNVGVSVVKDRVFASAVASSDASGITSSVSSSTIGSKLVSGTEYYVEVVNGPTSLLDTHVGHRFEVDEVATIASDDAYVTLDVSSALNTTSTVPDLSGYAFELRPHFTFNEVFPKEDFHAHFLVTLADQMLVYNGTGYDTHFLYELGGTKEWRRFGSTNSEDGRVMPPGEGMVFDRHDTTSVEVVLVGKVRTNPFRQPLVTGFNLVSEGFPYTATPSERGLLDMAFTGAATSTGADEISVWDEVADAYDVYFLYEDGGARHWTLDGGTGGNEDGSDLFDFTGSVFLDMQADHLDYRTGVLSP